MRQVNRVSILDTSDAAQSCVCQGHRVILEGGEATVDEV